MNPLDALKALLGAAGAPLRTFMDVAQVPQDALQGAQAHGRQFSDTPFIGWLEHDPTGIVPALTGAPGFAGDVAAQGWDQAVQQARQTASDQPEAYPYEHLAQGFAPNLLPLVGRFTNPLGLAATGMQALDAGATMAPGALGTLLARNAGRIGQAANLADRAYEYSYAPFLAGMGSEMASDALSADDQQRAANTGLANLMALALARKFGTGLVPPNVVQGIDAAGDLYRARKAQTPTGGQ